MLKTRVIPTLLLKNRGLVKSVKFKDYTYVGDPLNAIKIFNEKEVDELIVLDISASIEKRRPPMDLISEMAGECFMPLGYGGGVRNIDDVKNLFSLGVEKVIINSCASENPEFIAEAADKYGSQSVVVSIDVKKDLWGNYRVYSHGGTVKTKATPVEYAVQMEKLGAGEVILNSIDLDGIMMGYDLRIIKMVSDAINIPLVACGGAGKVEDFASAVDAGASAVAAGSIFVFHGIHRAVLISYPNQNELQRVLGG